MLDRISHSERRGIGAAFATALLAFLAWAFPNMSRLLTIPGAIICATLVVYFLWPEIKSVASWSRTLGCSFSLIRLIIFATLVLSVGAVGAVWIYGMPAFMQRTSPEASLPLVAEEFDRARLPGLGPPTGKIETTNGMYQASHERAMVVALLPIQDIFIFPKDQTRKGLRYHYAATDDARKWWDDAFLRSRFKAPKDKNPPESIVAVAWAANPDQFKWIGWREWSCPFTLDKFYYQTFQNGIIFGVLPTNETLGSSQIFTFLNTGEWSSIEPIDKAGGLSAPGCNENTARANGVVIHGRFTKPPPKP
jgi:hypothetical protein